MSESTLPTFAELGVPDALVKALAARGITQPFPIQAASLPTSMAGRDVLGKGRTGSGKTVAFALPIVARLAESQPERRYPGRPRALVLVPTRELAVQVAETIEALGQAVGLRTMTVFGGVRYDGQVRKLARGTDIVVATPGRLEDLLEQGVCHLDDIESVVIDEADLMADMGFLPSVEALLTVMPRGQRMLFSATLDNAVASIVERFLTKPLVHSVDVEASGADTEHHLLLISMDNKAAIVRQLVSGEGRTLAFTRTKTYAERLARELGEAGIAAVELHGNLSQAQRQRNLAAFAEGRARVLVATDIAARGIHVDGIGLVVHVDPPIEPKAFLHRSGRTARAGASGVVVTLATRRQNKPVRALLAQAHIKPIQTLVEPGHPLIKQLQAPATDAPAGESLFAPIAEDEVELDWREQRATHGHPDKRKRSQPARDGRRDERPRRGREDAPRRTPRPQRTNDRLRAERPGRAQSRADAWAQLEGELAPFEVERGVRPERGTERADRGGDPGRGRGARGERSERREWGSSRPERPQRAGRGAPERGERGQRDDRVRSEARPAKKSRWSDDDRAKRDQHSSWREDAGLAPRGKKSKASAKPAPKRAKKVQNKDKGKPKRRG